MRICTAFSYQMILVSAYWQAYVALRATRSIEDSALIMGMLGLTMFVSMAPLSMFGGQAADRYDRKSILQITVIARLLIAVALALVMAFAPGILLPALFVGMSAMGAVSAFQPAAASAILARLVPREELSQAVALNSLGFQAATIGGPALAGLLLVHSGEAAFTGAACFAAAAWLFLAGVERPEHKPAADARALTMMREGLAYVASNRIVLGAISLDLVVAFFGGLVVLIPVFAKDILHMGALGQGLLRSSIAVGAAVAAAWLAVSPLRARVGLWMFVGVTVYGLATLVFAFSTAFWLSMAALAVTGAGDMISVYVRQSLIQLATPDHMRGRVAAVSFIGISASNELGDFESGVAARLLGPVGAVALGGGAAIAATGGWIKLFPDLWRAGSFEDVQRKAEAMEMAAQRAREARRQRRSAAAKDSAPGETGLARGGEADH